MQQFQYVFKGVIGIVEQYVVFVNGVEVVVEFIKLQMMQVWYRFIDQIGFIYIWEVDKVFKVVVVVVWQY